MPNIKLKIDFLSTEKLPSEILVSLIRECNEELVNVKFPTSYECLIEGPKIRIKKSDIEKTFHILIPSISNWYTYLKDTPVWKKYIIGIEGNIAYNDGELIIEKVPKPELSNRRQSLRVPVALNLMVNIKNEKDYKRFNGIITDISEDGIGISSTEIPDLKQMLEISFEFKNIGLKFEDTKAIVEWGRKDIGKFGAKWLELPDNTKNILKYLTPSKI